jgi:uncharacterized membrane protein YGL010W
LSENNSLAIQRSRRIAGILLAASLLILLLALIILLVRGALPAFAAGLRGSLAAKAPYAATFHWLNLLWTAGWIVQLLGFGMFTRLLLSVDDESLAILPFLAVLIAAIIGVLHGTFHMTVESWASLETARTGNIPEAYEPLRDWIGSSFRVAYVLHLAAIVGFGWGILRTGLLAPWVGWAAIGWGILWLAGYLVGVGAPAILFIMPAVIGIALLRR